MDLHHLKVFVSVYKNRSFSKASGQLHLTQPTVSDHIRSLEEELECRLFDRTGRAIIPTREAERLYPVASEVIEKVKDIKAAIGRMKEEIRGQLIIGASTIPGTYILPALASGFKKRYPDVSFQVVIEDSRRITDMVLGHELLVGVVGARMEQKKLDYQPLVDDELILAALPGLFKKAVTTGELVKVPFIMREEGSGTRKTMEKYLAQKGIHPGDMQVAAVLGSTASVREAIKAGLGASVISRLAVKEELESGVLEEIKIKGLEMKRSFEIITHKRRTLPRHYRAFLEYLREAKSTVSPS
jgi:DNA-binding transcriptional LysR family regulator